MKVGKILDFAQGKLADVDDIEYLMEWDGYQTYLVHRERDHPKDRFPYFVLLKGCDIRWASDSNRIDVLRAAIDRFRDIEEIIPGANHLYDVASSVNYAILPFEDKIQPKDVEAWDDFSDKLRDFAKENGIPNEGTITIGRTKKGIDRTRVETTCKTNAELKDELIDMTNRGVQGAARILYFWYQGGLIEDPTGDGGYMARCLSCLKGDLGMCWDMFRDHELLSFGFPEYIQTGEEPTIIMTSRTGYGDDPFRIEYRNMGSDGYLEPELFESIVLIRPYHMDPLDFAIRLDREHSLEKLDDMAKAGDTEAWYFRVYKGKDILIPAEPMPGIAWLEAERIEPEHVDEILDDAFDHIIVYEMIGYDIALDLFCGMKTIPDPQRALEFALKAAEYGLKPAKDLLIMMTDSPVPSDRIRGNPDGVGENGLYKVPLPMFLLEGMEWNTICKLTGCIERNIGLDLGVDSKNGVSI